MDIEFGISRTEAKVYNYHDLLYLHVAMAMNSSCCESLYTEECIYKHKGGTKCYRHCRSQKRTRSEKEMVITSQYRVSIIIHAGALNV